MLPKRTHLKTNSAVALRHCNNQKTDADLGRVLLRPVHVVHAVQQDLDGLRLEVELLVDLEGLLKHLIASSDLSHCRPIKVVQAVDVVLDARSVGLRKNVFETFLRFPSIIAVRAWSALSRYPVQSLAAGDSQIGCNRTEQVLSIETFLRSGSIGCL